MLLIISLIFAYLYPITREIHQDILLKISQKQSISHY